MNIKKIITGLTLLMLLSSGTANADWGDVYYCQQTNSLGITLGGEMTRYTPEKFQFKLDQTKNAMVFGSTGYFKDAVSELVRFQSFPSSEVWFANSTKYSMHAFEKGKFLYTSNGLDGAFVISADCDKF